MCTDSSDTRWNANHEHWKTYKREGNMKIGLVEVGMCRKDGDIVVRENLPNWRLIR